MSNRALYHLGGEWKRTHHCGELRGTDVGDAVVVAGWVKRVRELGYLTFLDLWDRTGIVQVVIEREQEELHELFSGLRAEDVIACAGVVRPRPEDMVNPDMATGEIEIAAEKVVVLNRSEVPPFTVTSDVQANEDLRLRYRYLDLRREPLQRNLELRHRLALGVREILSSEGFLEIETPMLVRRTPEGARDYLVPSRLQPGKFYALPQSPQLYKQILMVAGFDKYFQLARCLRDEDLRADRQPEHTQIDIEMSFVIEDDIFDISEKLMGEIFESVLDMKLELPFKRMDYAETIKVYGTDKPDLRYGLEIRDCSDIFSTSNFKIFRAALEKGGVVRGIFFEPGASFSRRRINDLETIVKDSGAGGLVAAKAGADGLTGVLEKYLDEGGRGRLLSLFGARGPGLALLVGGDEAVVSKSLGELRLQLGREYFLGRANTFNFLWINRFPLFTRIDGGGWEPSHHIFSMPLEEDLSMLADDPGKVRGHLYDLVCNGTELGSGSIRIHHRKLQEEVFNVIGISLEEARRKFGFLLEAFQFGAPPHGGIAIGLDRLAMIMGYGSSIRDYIAFPKTQSGASLMEGAPSEVDEDLLRELHIKVARRKNKEQ